MINKGYHIILAFIMLSFTGVTYGQVKVAYSDNTDDQAVAAGVVIHADPRLDILTHTRPKATVHTGIIHSGRGYRVQIYNGNDRNKAMSMKVDFMRRYPGVRTYMTYVSPQFRVKVGDYRSRGEAEKMYQQVEHTYYPSMIVPDFIVINPLKND